MKSLVLFATAAMFAGQAVAQCSAFGNTPSGTNLGLGDDGVRTVGLGFTFNFNGVAYTSISVCSNGYVWLGSGTSGDFSPTQSELATLAPRIAPLWWDLNPASTATPVGGGVFYSSDGSSRANVVWKNVPQFGTTTLFANFELSLASSGNINVYIDASNSVPVAPCIVGISRGGAGNPANTQDFLANYSTPAAIASATGTEAFAANQFDLSNLGGPGLGTTLNFTPTDSPTNSAFTNGGVANLPTCAPGVNPSLATASTIVGTGCPTAVPNGSIYELFTATTGTNPIDLATTSLQFTRSGNSYTLGAGPGFDSSYTTTGTIELGGGDDTLISYPLAMGTFTYGTINMTTAVVSSNGFIGTTGITQGFNASATTFHSGPARIAGYWKDMVPNTTTAPMWVENNASMFRMTWQNVPLFTGAGTQTFQIQLNSNGDVILSYGALTGAVTTSPPLAGLSGGGATNLGNHNLVTAGVPNGITRQITGGFTAMSHTSTLAGLGTNFVMTTTVPSTNSGWGLWFVGASNPNLPLDAFYGIGAAPGCSLYSDGAIDMDLFGLFPAGNTTFNKTIAVPYNTALSGVVIFTQAGALSTLNAAGVISSNGRTQTVGL